MNFGTPKAVAKQYLPETDFKKVKRKMYFRRALIIVFSLIIFLFTIYISTILYKHITRGNTVVYISPVVEITTSESEVEVSYEKN